MKAPRDGDNVRVVPNATKVVMNPDTGRLVEPKGADVTWNSYWRRREADGSIRVEARTNGAEPVILDPKE